MFQQSLSIVTKPVLDSLSLSLANPLHAAYIMVVFILWLLQAVVVFCSSRFSYSVVKSNTYCYIAVIHPKQPMLSMANLVSLDS